MPEIKLSKGAVTLVDECDLASLVEYRWFLDANGYARTNTPPRYMHRFIMRPPPGLVVDHINHDKLDNRRSNLRVCTYKGSNGNLRPQTRGASRYKGVFAVTRTRGKPWRAQINQAGRTVYLGCFWTEEEAAHAYDAAARDYFGEFAWLNFPEPELRLRLEATT